MRKSIVMAAAAAAIMSMAAVTPSQAGVITPAAAAGAVQTTLGSQLDATRDAALRGPDISAKGLVEDVGYRRRRRHLGYGAAGLITLGVIGAIAANRAHSRPYYREGYGNQCHVWRRRCNYGNDRACWNFDRRC